MRGIRWSPEAFADLDRIDTRHREIDPDYSRQIGNDVVKAAYFLAEFPQAGTAIPGKPVRKWRVGSSPYLLLYRPSQKVIEIARLVHHARDWTRFV